ncbi:hypothetical protein BH160DRAFT_1273 [Burkholderia sp. H160]|nr:hypothetical protein BH160DRAFT_1273 [Burkholderia sp. H160]
MWCPLCLGEMARTGLVYYPLLWRMKGVLACPIHKVLLMKACCCNGQNSIPGRRRKHHPGICVKCGRLLYGEGQPAPSPASDGAVCQSSMILGLLADSQLIAGVAREKLVGNLASFLGRASKEAFGGASSRLATALGYRKNTLWYWLHGLGMPKIEVLARLAVMFEVPISQMLLGDCQKQLVCTQTALECRRPTRYCERHSSEECRAAMVRLRGESSVPMSIAAMARQIGVDPGQLWKAAPQLAAEISFEAKKHRQMCKQLREVRLEAVFYDEAHAIADTGRVPTQRLVFVNRRHEIGSPGRSMIQLCAKICALVRDHRSLERKTVTGPSQTNAA